MTKEQLINKTLNTLSRLPNDKIWEIYDFADYLLKKYEEEIILKGAENLMNDSKAFEFLEEEEELYTKNDLKEKFK